MPTLINGRVSHWFDAYPSPRAHLPGDRDADVCIVGAGYTGLWTAYYLKRSCAAPGSNANGAYLVSARSDR